jgi:hypothetical protein
MTRRIKFGKFGLAEDPIGLDAVFGDSRVARIVGTYRRDEPPAIMLRLRYFNGEDAPDLAASYVYVLELTHNEEGE